MRTDPPPSVPSAKVTAPAETVAAEPPLDPPADEPGNAGLATGPTRGSRPHPNSFMFVLPTSTAPAVRRRATAAASSEAGGALKNEEPPVVGASMVRNVSLAANGMPASGPGSSRAVNRLSTARASRRAAARMIVM